MSHLCLGLFFSGIWMMLKETIHPFQVNSGRRQKLGIISEIYYSSNISNFQLNFKFSQITFSLFWFCKCKAESTRARAELDWIGGLSWHSASISFASKTKNNNRNMEKSREIKPGPRCAKTSSSNLLKID